MPVVVPFVLMIVNDIYVFYRELSDNRCDDGQGKRMCTGTVAGNFLNLVGVLVVIVCSACRPCRREKRTHLCVQAVLTIASLKVLFQAKFSNLMKIDTENSAFVVNPYDLMITSQSTLYMAFLFVISLAYGLSQESLLLSFLLLLLQIVGLAYRHSELIREHGLFHPLAPVTAADS